MCYVGKEGKTFETSKQEADLDKAVRQSLLGCKVSKK